MFFVVCFHLCNIIGKAHKRQQNEQNPYQIEGILKQDVLSIQEAKQRPFLTHIFLARPPRPILLPPIKTFSKKISIF
jgi:hypothetical protein